jgi:hypothetical protein
MVKATHLGEKTLNKSWFSRLEFVVRPAHSHMENILLKKVNEEMLDR